MTILILEDFLYFPSLNQVEQSEDIETGWVAAPSGDEKDDEEDDDEPGEDIPVPSDLSEAGESEVSISFLLRSNNKA